MAAPHSGSGKTLVALGLVAAFGQRGPVAVAKCGPDYIDPAFLSRAAKVPAFNLDPFAMSPERLRYLVKWHALGTEMLVVEGVMGLFDGAANGPGSTADLAAILGMPVILVVDCRGMGQSIAALAEGFARHRSDIHLGGVVLNHVASDRHEAMLRTALANSGIACLGALRRDPALEIPDRHLGLVLPGAIGRIEDFLGHATRAIARSLDLDAVAALAGPVPEPETIPLPGPRLPPLGQRIAIAQDAAFAFVYEHWLNDWAVDGASFDFFSPLADEPPDPQADAIFLPGGYPELHAEALARAGRFKAGLIAARDRGALIYGECGGYMVLGRALTIADGSTHAMIGLLPHQSRIDKPSRTLGYRRLTHSSPLPWPEKLTGHE
ncbi:MAG: cobyrinate a,c-diamide synthase, partial [Cucumibacter sp.]